MLFLFIRKALILRYTRQIRKKIMTIIIKSGEVTFSELESVYWGDEVSKLHEDTHLAIKKGAAGSHC